MALKTKTTQPTDGPGISKPLTTIAVDPGKHGGIAVRRPDGNTDLFKMPEPEAGMIDIFKAAVSPEWDTVAYVESVGGYIGVEQPGSRMFTFGHNAGFIHGSLSTLGVPVYLMRPQAWQKALGLGSADKSIPRTRRATAWKTKLKGEAMRRYPNHHITLKTADALLILEAGPLVFPHHSQL